LVKSRRTPLPIGVKMNRQSARRDRIPHRVPPRIL